MANVTKELVLNETFMSTEQTPRNVADILADELENIANAIEGGGSGGHIIQDASGTDLAQEAKLQFGGMLKATDDATNGVTKVSDLAEEIEWSAWDAMTEAQRTAYSVGKKLDIIHAPFASGSIPVELIKTLWTNPNPSEAFEAQSITLASDDYDFLLMVAKNQSAITSNIAPKGNGIWLNFTNSNITSERRALYVSNTSLNIQDATANGNVNNSALIPLAIYGIKSSVNVDMSALVANVSTSASKCMLSDGETSVEDALNNVIKDFALGNERVLYIPIKYTSNYSLMYLHIFGIYAGASTAFQSVISARNNNNNWVFSSTDTNISVDKFGDNLRITFPNAYATGSYIVRYVGT